MPKVQINDVNINYRISGDGEEVLVILNGMMMSVASWMEMVPFYTRAGYKVINVDFRDQGESGSSPIEYSHEQHVEDIKDLLDYLQIGSCTLMGISYGGKVAMMTGLKYPERIKGLILANTTSRLTTYLSAIINGWDEAAKLKDGEKFFKLVMPFIYSGAFYEKRAQWLSKQGRIFKSVATEEWFERYLRMSSSLVNYNISEAIDEIKIPTLVIASDQDMVTPYQELQLIHEKIKDSLLVVLPETGHASYYEKSRAFSLQVLGFLAMNQGRKR